MKTFNIQRTRQLFAFNQYVSLFLDGKFCGKLGNGDHLTIDVNQNNAKLEAKSCFGNKSLSLNKDDFSFEKITVKFGVSDLLFLLTMLFFIVLASVIIGLIWYVNINFSAFIFLFSAFFIIRNRKQLHLIKN